MSDRGFPVCCYCGRVAVDRGSEPWTVEEMSYFVCRRVECVDKMHRHDPYRFEGYVRLVEVRP